MAALDLKEALAIIRSGNHFDCSVITANLAQKKGGKIINYKRVRIARRDTMEKAGAVTTSFTGFTKAANHNKNFTVNLELPNGSIEKIHPALVFSINNQPVI